MAGSAFLLVGLLALAFLHQSDDRPPHLRLRMLTAWAPGGLDEGTAKWLFLAFIAALRGQGAAVPVPHLAARRAHRGADRGLGGPGRRASSRWAPTGSCASRSRSSRRPSVDLAPLLLVLAVIGIIYGAIVAAMQTEPETRRSRTRRSRTSGFVVLGIFALTTQGIEGGVFTMLSHGLTTGALFLLVGMLYDRRHTYEHRDVRRSVEGRCRSSAGCSSPRRSRRSACPASRASSASSCRCSARSSSSRRTRSSATTGVILAAVYLLWAFQRVFTGEPERREPQAPGRSTSASCASWSRCSRSACSSASTRSRCSTASSRR